LNLFLIATAAILVAAAVSLCAVLGSAVRTQAASDIRGDLHRAAATAFRSPVALRSRLLRNPSSIAHLRQRLLADPDVAAVEVFRGPAAPPSQVGAGRATYDVPVTSSANGTRIGTYRLFSVPHDTAGAVASRERLVWFVVAAVFLALFGMMVLLVRCASGALERRKSALHKQSDALLDAQAQLKRSSIEAIESLNAAVDAKDPSTAGHSQRVVEIAVKIGRQLDLADDELELLRLGALFHDIGKLAVPDSILLKPGRLTGGEFEVIKHHCDDGARIVDRFGPLRPAAEIVKHHHERWSGDGYPTGIAGDAIPLAASIVGLADAWDAMTTSRLYKETLSDEEAISEVRRGRGTQFRLEVVDAFERARERDPALFASEAALSPLDLSLNGHGRRLDSQRLGAAEDAFGFSEA
jgi:putative nucleotidyltransferase with HDIG domain